MDESFSYRFPFEKCEKGSRIVIYGAGQVGCEYLLQLQHKNEYNVLWAVDKNYENNSEFFGVEVFSPEILSNIDEYDYVVVSSYRYADEIMLNLEKLGVPQKKIITEFQFGMGVYASRGEDLVVSTIFKLLGKRIFSYIDIGANDPYFGSNTAYMHLHNCRGICIEPNPDLYDRIKEQRPEDIVLNVGVAPETGTLPYYMFKNNIYNTFSQDTAMRSRAASSLVGTKDIAVVTLNSIIQEYANGIYPDFLQIDIEGYDYAVLEASDFSKSSPMVICAEAGDWNINEMNEMLWKKGYFPFHRSKGNVVYIRNDIREKFPDIVTLGN